MFDDTARARSIIVSPQQGGEDAHIADPLADLLLSVAAIIVLVVIAILPTIPRHPVSRTDRAGLAQDWRFRLENREVHPFFATRDGLLVEGSSSLIPVDRIFLDDGLVATLERMRRSDEVVALLVAPDGHEAAFQFEVIASRHGPRRLRQVRLDSDCNFVTSGRVGRYCGVPAPSGQNPIAVNSPPQTISAITDISANIFAVLILILIAIVAVRERAPLQDVAPRDLDLETDVASVERAPLGSDELFDLLYERRDGAPSIKIDLFNARIDAVIDGKAERFESGEKAAVRFSQLAAVSSRPSVTLYVFDNRFYRGMTDRLKAAGWTWREMSVPQALRESGPGTKRQAWSRGFRALIAQSPDRTRFRAELARLLQSSAADRPFDPGPNGEGGAMRQGAETIVQRLVRWWRVTLEALAITGGLVFVGWVEKARPRSA